MIRFSPQTSRSNYQTRVRFSGSTPGPENSVHTSENGKPLKQKVPCIERNKKSKYKNKRRSKTTPVTLVTYYSVPRTHFRDSPVLQIRKPAPVLEYSLLRSRCSTRSALCCDFLIDSKIQAAF